MAGALFFQGLATQMQALAVIAVKQYLLLRRLFPRGLPGALQRGLYRHGCDLEGLMGLLRQAAAHKP